MKQSNVNRHASPEAPSRADSDMMDIAVIMGALSVKALETIRTVHPGLTLVPAEPTMVAREWHLNGDIAIVGSSASFGYSPFDQPVHCDGGSQLRIALGATK